MKTRVCAFAASAAMVAISGTALGQYSQNCEALTTGILPGQDNWFQPVAGSNEWNVVGYEDEAMFNIALNPAGGGELCVAATANASANGFARGQRFVDWSSNDSYTVCFDFYADYQGDETLHASNVGSISTQPFGATTAPSNQGTNTLFYYNIDGDITSDYSISWPIYDAAGGSDGAFYNPDDLAGTWPAGPFSTLKLRKWYRVSYVMNFVTGELGGVGIEDLSNGSGGAYIPDPGSWHIAGGAGNALALPRPDQLRFFVGGQGNGNVVAIDNINITAGNTLCVDPTEPCPADFNGDGFVDGFDYDDFVACFEGDPCPPGQDADYNNDGFPDGFDYDEFVADFEEGCL